jgi:hypothetical protein
MDREFVRYANDGWEMLVLKQGRVSASHWSVFGKENTPEIAWTCEALMQRMSRT